MVGEDRRGVGTFLCSTAMATKRDFYEVLGVPKNASEDEIKKSYRKLAMKHHPDRNQGDASAEVKFKEAKEAYEMLSDAEKRAAYDQFGHAGVDPNKESVKNFVVKVPVVKTDPKDKKPDNKIKNKKLNEYEQKLAI